ncbi:glutathione peroxidase [Clostridium frigoris]|uniref:Glutathione peroxidase n=1 Tax=Clostridium frigoris TaxID=205327 RepID=A0ABS6BTX6_9CLOT|nr:glutathione peroxidase [Clostridium frigoris]
MSIYDFKAITIDGEKVSLNEYKGKVLVIVNTASKCGFTPQYEGLEKLYNQYKDKGLEILGFPSNQFLEQEPGESSEIKKFCQINYGVSFPLFEKTDVRGENAHPIFKYLTEKARFKGFDLNKANERKFNDMLEKRFPELLVGDSIKWNFTKFLIGRDGNVEHRYEPTTTPEDISTDIEKLICTSIGNDVSNKKMYTGEDDEEVPNCEGGPCNFVYHDDDEN